jgi:uncharacterized membrane protein YfcA
MALQNILLLMLAAVLVTIGITQLTRSGRRNRAQRQRSRTGMLLIVIGFVVGLIVSIGWLGG